jgi:hypothetical protein
MEEREQVNFLIKLGEGGEVWGQEIRNLDGGRGLLWVMEDNFGRLLEEVEFEKFGVLGIEGHG